MTNNPQVLYRVSGWSGGTDMPTRISGIFDDEGDARTFARKCEGIIEVLHAFPVKHIDFWTQEQEYLDFCYPEDARRTLIRSTHLGVEEVTTH